MPADAPKPGKPPADNRDPLARLSDLSALQKGVSSLLETLTEIDPVELAASLKARVIGQNQVIDSICARLHRRIAAKRPNKPIAVFCFAGAPGVGKSYLAENIAEKLYGNRKHYHFFEMAKFNHALTASGLFGVQQGLVGYGQKGALTRALRDVPNSIIVLDEFEKAAREVHTQFLSAWNDGFITEQSDQSKHSTREAIFILTVNSGARQIAEYARSNPSIAQDDLNKFARGALQDDKFAPEVLSRIDDVFAFRELAGLDIARVVALEMEKSARSYGLDIAGGGIDPQILITAIDTFTKTKPEGGVREIARHLEDRIADGLIAAKRKRAKQVMFEADGEDEIRVVPIEDSGDGAAATTTAQERSVSN